MREFELLGTGEDKPNPMLLERLKACAAVIDALGYKACCSLSACCLLPLRRGKSILLSRSLKDVSTWSHSIVSLARGKAA